MTKKITNQIPDGWKESTLADHMTFSNGRTSPDRQYGGTYPVYGANGIIGYSEETNSNEDTLIVGRVGAYCGSVYYSTTRCWITDNAIRGQTRDDTNPYYMFYLLGTLHLNSRAGGSGHPLLNQSTLNAIEIIAPEKNEQKAIADVLSSLDDKIELLRKQNESLEAIAQTIFKEWFVNFNFPDKNDKPYKDNGGKMVDSELGRIPKDWQVYELRELMSFIKGKKPKKLSICSKEGFLPQILIDVFDGGKSIYADVSNTVVAETTDLMMVMDGASSGRVEIGFGGIVGSTLALLSVKQKIQSIIYLLLKIKEKDIRTNTTGSAIPHTDKDRVYNYHLVLPIQDKEKLDTSFSWFLEKIIANRSQIRTLSQLRDTLLPKLMRGQVRVKGGGK